jgi:hypothetical protein
VNQATSVRIKWLMLTTDAPLTGLAMGKQPSVSWSEFACWIGHALILILLRAPRMNAINVPEVGVQEAWQGALTNVGPRSFTAKRYQHHDTNIGPKNQIAARPHITVIPPNCLFQLISSCMFIALTGSVWPRLPSFMSCARASTTSSGSA